MKAILQPLMQGTLDWRSVVAAVVSLNGLLVGLLLSLALLIKSIVVTRYFHPLSKFPGPFWASVTRLWIAVVSLSGKEHEVLYKLHERYGPIVRITPTMLMCSDPRMLPVIYHRRAEKGNHYSSGGFGKVKSSFTIQPHEAHTVARKRIAHAYSFSAIKPAEKLIDNRITEWLNKITVDFADTGTMFNFSPWSTYLAYDVISEIAFGKSLGFVRNGYDLNNLIKSFHEMLAPVGILCRVYPIAVALKDTWFADRFLTPSPGDGSAIGHIMEFRDVLMDERANEMLGYKRDRVDLLQSFLNAKNADGTPMDIEDVKAETLLVLLGGSDTTATGLQSFLFQILTHPEVYQKVISEIKAGEAAGLLSSSSPIVQYDEVLKHFPYYVACVREAMRLYPSAPNFYPRLTPEGGQIICGQYIPEGSEVTCNPYVIQRFTEVYGSDAHIYRPERWLENPEKTREFDSCDFTFGYGSRVCLGKHIALMELYKVPFQFLRTFEPELVNKEIPATYVNSGGIARFVDFWLTVRRT